MTTFTAGHHFTHRTVLPFVSYAVSGLGSVERDHAAAGPGARIGNRLAVRCEEATQHGADVERLASDGWAHHVMTKTGLWRINGRSSTP